MSSFLLLFRIRRSFSRKSRDAFFAKGRMIPFCTINLKAARHAVLQYNPCCIELSLQPFILQFSRYSIFTTMVLELGRISSDQYSMNCTMDKFIFIIFIVIRDFQDMKPRKYGFIVNFRYVFRHNSKHISAAGT